MSRRRRTRTVVAPVELTVRGEVYDRARAYVVKKVEAAIRSAGTPVRHAHAVLTLDRDPALERPARLEVGLDVDGVPVRVHATGHHVGEAADLAEDRLRRRLRQLRDRTRTRHRWIGISREHEWRHGDLPRPRVPYFPRPSGERLLLKRKTFALEPMTQEQAAYEMRLVDHDFYLFADRATGQDRVLVRGRHGARERVAVAGPPPTLTDVQACERLDVGGEPFVFYLDPVDGRGRVLYRRYDGHYGLIVGTSSESGETEG